jgi:hypothetical protein
MKDLWDQLALIESAKLKAYSAYIERREQQWLVQFLTALHNDFEGLKGLILHRSPLPFVDSIVSELLAEEIHLQSYSKKGILSASNPSLLAVPSKQFSNHHHKPYISLILSAVFVSKKVIGKLSVLSWDNRIKLGSLAASHNLMLIDHLRVINHHTTIPQQQLPQSLLPILVLWLSNFRRFSHCSHKQCLLLLP